MKQLKKYEKLLRRLPTQEMILNNERRVSVLKGEDAYTFLKSKDMDDSAISALFDQLLYHEMLVKGMPSKDNRTVSISISRKFNRKDSYIWVEDQTSNVHMILSIVLVLVVLVLIMYQVWPSRIRSKMTYVFYPVFAFVIFLGVLAIVRLIVFSVTIFMYPPGIWLFPNLFADVGFIDSFIPVWSYHGVDTRPKKKRD